MLWRVFLSLGEGVILKEGNAVVVEVAPEVSSEAHFNDSFESWSLDFFDGVKDELKVLFNRYWVQNKIFSNSFTCSCGGKQLSPKKEGLLFKDAKLAEKEKKASVDFVVKGLSMKSLCDRAEFSLSIMVENEVLIDTVFSIGKRQFRKTEKVFVCDVKSVTSYLDKEVRSFLLSIEDSLVEYNFDLE